MRGLNLKKTEAGTRRERLSSTNMGVPGAWSQPEEDGRRKQGQGRSTNPQPIWGSQVRGLNLKKTEDGSRDKAAALILNQYGGFRCVVST